MSLLLILTHVSVLRYLLYNAFRSISYHFRYAEVCKPGYTFGGENPAGGTLHFTQVVWKETKDLGMGKAVSERNGMTCTYVVGRYRKMGNMGGEYKDNVPQGSFTQSTCEKIQEMTDNLGKGNKKSTINETLTISDKLEKSSSAISNETSSADGNNLPSNVSAGSLDHVYLIISNYFYFPTREKLKHLLS